MNKKVSFSTTSVHRDYSEIELVEIAKKIGADGINLSLWYSVIYDDCIYSKSDDEICEYFTKVRKRADELGIKICQTHGRIRGYIDGDDEYNNVIHPKNARLDCMVTKILGAPVTVFHSSNTARNLDASPERMREMTFDMFTKSLEFAKEFDVQIATETFGAGGHLCRENGTRDFFGSISEFKNIYDRICAIGNNKDYFKICVDTGHTHNCVQFGEPSVGDTIRLLGKDIVCLHLHDNDGTGDSHRLPKSGTIDWDDVFDALDEIGYDGYYNLEVANRRFGDKLMVDTAEFSIKVLKNMLAERYGN